jgi:hypothetical protein
VDEKHFEAAAALEQLTRDVAIKKIQAKEQRLHSRPLAFDGTCPICADVIPEGRIAVGYFICIPCREELERRAALGLT